MSVFKTHAKGLQLARRAGLCNVWNAVALSVAAFARIPG